MELDISELDCRELDSSELDTTELDCHNSDDRNELHRDDNEDTPGHGQSEQSRVSHVIVPTPEHTRLQSGHSCGQDSQPAQVIHARS